MLMSLTNGDYTFISLKLSYLHLPSFVFCVQSKWCLAARLVISIMELNGVFLENVDEFEYLRSIVTVLCVYGGRDTGRSQGRI